MCVYGGGGWVRGGGGGIVEVEELGEGESDLRHRSSSSSSLF